MFTLTSVLLLSNLILLVPFASPVSAELAWRKLSVTGSYRPRAECSFTRCGGTRLCLIGGRGVNRVDILDTATMTWTQGVNHSMEMNHAQAVEGPDGCAWLAGSWKGQFPTENTVDDVWKYCPSADAWEKVTSIARPRGAGGTVFYKGKLYLVSGNVGGHNPQAMLVPWFDCYDPSSNTWTKLANVPHPRDHFHTAILNDKLYVIGGRDSTGENVFTGVEPLVDIYDFSTGTWQAGPDFPSPRGGSTTVTWRNSIVVLAGEGDGRAWSEVDLLSAHNQYSRAPDLPVPRHGTGAVACSSAIWIAGGATVQGCCDNAVDTYVLFDSNQANAPPPVCTPPGTTSDSPTSTFASPPPGTTLPVTSPPSSAEPLVPVSSPPPPPSSLSPSDPNSSPSSPATQTDDSDGTNTDDGVNSASEPACFPGDATVEMSTDSMAELYASGGHLIHVAATNKPSLSSKTTTSTTLVPMSSVQVGQTVMVNGSLQTVTSVTRAITKHGRFNPHTLHGDIVVNSFAVSSFTTAVHPTVANILLTPFRFLFHIVPPSHHAWLSSTNTAVNHMINAMYWRE